MWCIIPLIYPAALLLSRGRPWSCCDLWNSFLAWFWLQEILTPARDNRGKPPRGVPPRMSNNKTTAFLPYSALIVFSQDTNPKARYILWMSYKINVAAHLFDVKLLSYRLHALSLIIHVEPEPSATLWGWLNVHKKWEIVKIRLKFEAPTKRKESNSILEGQRRTMPKGAYGPRW